MFLDTKKLKEVSVSALEDKIASAIAELIGSEYPILCSISDFDFQQYGFVKLSLSLDSNISDVFSIES